MVSVAGALLVALVSGVSSPWNVATSPPSTASDTQDANVSLVVVDTLGVGQAADAAVLESPQSYATGNAGVGAGFTLASQKVTLAAGTTAKPFRGFTTTPSDDPTGWVHLDTPDDDGGHFNTGFSFFLGYEVVFDSASGRLVFLPPGSTTASPIFSPSADPSAAGGLSGAVIWIVLGLIVAAALAGIVIGVRKQPPRP
ncbi:hypothetical protein [Luethyella okanaganae]|uniref:Uncharacterized protein n=1 Tax=Luethyella okanaganae TaxID=69372 RepID=A0ABW1VCW6_9MICO